MMKKLSSVSRNLFRKYWQSRLTYRNTRRFLVDYFGISRVELAAIDAEFSQIFATKAFAIGGPQSILKDDALALYAIIRKVKPRLVVETGTYQGYSSHVIIEALKSNEVGEFVTCDVDDYRVFVNDFDKEKYRFLIGPSEKNLKTIPFDKVDIFFHDSNHHYDNVRFEIDTAVINKVPLILCHDFSRNNMHNNVLRVGSKGCRMGFIDSLNNQYDWTEIPTINGIGLAALGEWKMRIIE